MRELFVLPPAEAKDLNSEQKPWKTETRSHNSIDANTKQVKDKGSYFIENAIRLLPNWGIAIGLNIYIPTSEVIRLGGEGHRAILQRCPDLDSQWENIARLSADNFKSKYLYRNRRRGFGLRINLIAGIYNYELYLSSQQAIA